MVSREQQWRTTQATIAQKRTDHAWSVSDAVEPDANGNTRDCVTASLTALFGVEAVNCSKKDILRLVQELFPAIFQLASNAKCDIAIPSSATDFMWEIERHDCIGGLIFVDSMYGASGHMIAVVPTWPSGYSTRGYHVVDKRDEAVRKKLCTAEELLSYYSLAEIMESDHQKRRMIFLLHNK
jgi:hypothetical protein